MSNPSDERALVSQVGAAEANVRLGLVPPCPPHVTEVLRGEKGRAPRYKAAERHERSFSGGSWREVSRAVVLPVSAPWVEHAQAIIDAVERLSIMGGPTVVIWNDKGSCPLRLTPRCHLITYGEGSLGWAGISTALGKVYADALDWDVSWVIKLDTDTAILSKGWDAAVFKNWFPVVMLGTVVDVTRIGLLPADMTLHNEKLGKMPWAQHLVGQGHRRFNHIQGGCYALGIGALQKISEAGLLQFADQSAVPERARVPEDVLFDTMAKVAGVCQVNSPSVSSWFQCPALDGPEPPTPEQIDHIRYHRDELGVVAWHPVKHLPTLKLLCEEAQDAR